jgi:hypothetical protein
VQNVESRCNQLKLGHPRLKNSDTESAPRATSPSWAAANIAIVLEVLTLSTREVPSTA